MNGFSASNFIESDDSRGTTSGVERLFDDRGRLLCSVFPRGKKDGVEEKECEQCHQWKPLDKFYKNSSERYGRHFLCRVCCGVNRKTKSIEPVETPTKRCTSCGIVKKLDRFYQYSVNKDKHANQCKVCIKIYRQDFIHQLKNRWHSMVGRCSNPDRKGYKNYGGRGIECRFTDFNDFICFVMSVLGMNSIEKLTGLQIDRINNDGHYEMGNIRFVTAKINANNKRKRIK